MNLQTELLRGVYAYGFERPSAFQQRAFMPIIKGRYKILNDRKSMLDSSSQSRKAAT